MCILKTFIKTTLYIGDSTTSGKFTSREYLTNTEPEESFIVFMTEIDCFDIWVRAARLDDIMKLL